MHDLIVIGGGPAGTAAAITAARGGAKVLLLERGKFPRHKVCGEFVSPESLGFLAQLLRPQDADILRSAVPISRARIFLDHRILESPVEPAAASVARFDLDAALWASAEQDGVEAWQPVAVQGIGGTGPFTVTARDQDLAARAVVNASGRWSNLSSAPPPNGGAKWIGIKGHFSEAAPPASVDLYFFDGGYCGVQPVDLRADSGHSRVNACAMVRAEVASTLTEVFAQHPALYERSRHWQPLSDPVATSPLFFRKPQPEQDGVLQVGDAAGFVDPFVGDGISLALRSGALAASCLLPFLTGRTGLREAAWQYRQAYERQLAPVFRMSSRIRRMLTLPRAVRVPILSALEHAPAMTRYLVRKTR